MKTQKNNTARKILIGFLIAGAIIIAVPFCMGLYVGITSHTGTTGDISKTLKENCNCKKIAVDHSAFGLQFNKEDGLTSEKAAYTLKDCKLDKTIAVEANRLNEILVSNIADYKELDVVHLNFINGDKEERIVIKKGKLQ